MLQYCTYFHANGKKGKIPELVRQIKEAHNIDIMGYVIRN
jgi:hypothetical protein